MLNHVTGNLKASFEIPTEYVKSRNGESQS